MHETAAGWSVGSTKLEEKAGCRGSRRSSSCCASASQRSLLDARAVVDAVLSEHVHIGGERYRLQPSCRNGGAATTVEGGQNNRMADRAAHRRPTKRGEQALPLSSQSGWIEAAWVKADTHLRLARAWPASWLKCPVFLCADNLCVVASARSGRGTVVCESVQQAVEMRGDDAIRLLARASHSCGQREVVERNPRL